MTDETDKELDKMIAHILGLGPPCGRRRGRPRNGFTKALQYTDEYFELRFSGWSSWHAMLEVAKRNRKTPQHIAACVKMVKETPPHEINEPDYTEDPNYGNR